MICLVILLIILALILYGGCEAKNKSGRLVSFPETASVTKRREKEDLLSQIVIKGGYQEVTPNPPSAPICKGTWGTAVPTWGNNHPKRRKNEHKLS